MPRISENAEGEVRSNIALCAKGLSYRYAQTQVYRAVSFRLDAGRIAFLTGPNGAGKSTLLRVLAGWDAPCEGEVQVCGEPLRAHRRDQRALVAFVPDAPVFYDDLTAGEHVEFVLRANRRHNEIARADELMEAFGLTGHRHQVPSSYSRGMRQKLALVLALMLQPRVLLLDEPYGPLDGRASAVLSGFLAEARADGAAALVSCHHEVPNLEADMLLHLEDGRLTAPPCASGTDAQGR